MVARIIPATEFRENCLALLDEVSVSGDEILITRGGRAVARVVPPHGRATPGSARLLTADELLGTVDWDDEDDLVGPTGEPLPGEGRGPTVVDLSDSILYEGDLLSSVWYPLTTDTPDYRI